MTGTGAKDFRNRMDKDSVPRYSAPGVYHTPGPTFGMPKPGPSEQNDPYDPYREQTGDDWPQDQPAIMPPDFVRHQFPDPPREIQRLHWVEDRDNATEMGWGPGSVTALPPKHDAPRWRPVRAHVPASECVRLARARHPTTQAGLSWLPHRTIAKGHKMASAKQKAARAKFAAAARAKGNTKVGRMAASSASHRSKKRKGKGK